MKFHVPDISCGHCTAAIDKALKAIDPDARVDTPYLEDRHDRVNQGCCCAPSRPEGDWQPRHSSLTA